MSEQVILDREAPPWAQRLQTDINALMTRLDRRVKTVNNTLSTGTTSLQGQIDTLQADLDAAEAALVALGLEVDAIPLITAGTPVATTSGASVDFTGLPSGLKRITLALDVVSTNGTSELLLQIGDSGGVQVTGYHSQAASLATTSAAADSSTIGIILVGSWAAAYTFSGIITLALLSASTNTWSVSALGTRSSASVAPSFAAGSKSLSGVLDRVRLTTVGGVNTFDAGTVNILYE